MTQIAWSEATFTSASSASSGDDEIRSLLTNLATGLGTSWYWPGSAASQGASTASSGELRLGTLRFARAGNSARTGGYGDGFLLLDSTHVSLHHIGASGNTGFLSHSAMLVRDGGFTFPQTARWLYQEGLVVTGSATSGTSTTSFVTAYGAPPIVMLTSIANDKMVVGLSSISTGGFTSHWSIIGAALQDQFGWFSEGTAAF